MVYLVSLFQYYDEGILQGTFSCDFTVNGKSRLVRGSAGEGAVVTLNGRPANLHTPIEQNDIIM